MERALALAARAGDEARRRPRALQHGADRRMDAATTARAIALSEQVIAAGRRLRLAHLVDLAGLVPRQGALLPRATTARRSRAHRGRGGLRPHRRSRVEEPAAQHARLVPRRDRRASSGRASTTSAPPRSRTRSATRRSSPTPRSTSPPTTSRSATSSGARGYLDAHRAAAGAARAIRGCAGATRCTRATSRDAWRSRGGDPSAALALARRRDRRARGAIARRRSRRARSCSPARRCSRWTTRQDAQEALAERDRGSPTAIGYPRAARAALAPLAELARRAGRAEEAARHDVRRRALLEYALHTLSEDELRRDLAAAAEH